MAQSIAVDVWGVTVVIWAAIVAMRVPGWFLVLSDLEKKKLASSMLSVAHFSAMLCMIADFPAPAGPYSHRIARPCRRSRRSTA